VPGPEGGNGTNGTNGVNAFTLTTSNFTIPTVDGTTTVTIAVANSTWMVVGQILIATGPVNLKVTAIPTTTGVTVIALGYPGDVAAGNTVLSGSTISPSGQRGGGTLYYKSTAADLTLNAFNDVVEVTADAKTITLPTAVGISGKVYTVKITAAGGATITPAGGQTIDGLATFVLNGQNSFVSVISNGANWDVIGKGTNHYTTTAIDLTATAAMDVIEITGATKTVTLPTAVGITGKVYTIKLTAASTGTVAGAGAENIDAANTYSLSAQYKFVAICSNGVGWIIISKN
jgi:hypothetical protein